MIARLTLISLIMFAFAGSPALAGGPYPQHIEKGCVVVEHDDGPIRVCKVRLRTSSHPLFTDTGICEFKLKLSDSGKVKHVKLIRRKPRELETFCHKSAYLWRTNPPLNSNGDPVSLDAFYVRLTIERNMAEKLDPDTSTVSMQFSFHYPSDQE